MFHDLLQVKFDYNVLEIFEIWDVNSVISFSYLISIAINLNGDI